jgi:GT2 family glycosyltransferase
VIAAASPVAAVWAALPPALHKRLLFPADDPSLLLRLAQDHLGAMTAPSRREILAPVFADMVLCAFESTFLDPQAASALSQVQKQIPFLPPEAAAFAARLASAAPASPEDGKEAERLLAKRNIQALQAFLDEKRHREKDPLFWLGPARRLGIHLGEGDWYEPWLASCALPEPVARILRADWHFSRRDWDQAAAGYEAALSRMPLPGLEIRLGECLRRLGQREKAAGMWQRALARRPWQINLILRLTDCLQGRDLPGDIPPGKGHILLYSWNHEADLRQTLDSLAQSRLGSARVLALDNGSSDGTSILLRAFARRMGDAAEVISLPVNIGAPAARNWLLAHERVRDSDWAVFLDDDALVPPDWLEYFGAALKAYPQAGIIGCRVVEKAAPLTIQSADLHFDLQDETLRTGTHPGNNVLNDYIRGADFGQYSYLRPCVSVTGCCHLLTRQSRETIGGFDLRFSPSQFDDFERDLRSADKGVLPAYQGYLAVRHIKRNNMVTGITPEQQANVAGNLVKLWKTYSPEQVTAIARKDLRAASQDLRLRLQFLEQRR